MNNSLPGNKTSSLKTDRVLLSICCRGPAWERCQGGAGAAGGGWGWGDALVLSGRDLSATCCRVSWIMSLNAQRLFSLHRDYLLHRSPRSEQEDMGRGHWSHPRVLLLPWPWGAPGPPAWLRRGCR